MNDNTDLKLTNDKDCFNFKYSGWPDQIKAIPTTVLT